MTPSAGGIVLCGGQSSRMGHPKAWLPFGDECLLQRVVRILSSSVWPIVVVSAPGQSLPELPVAVEIVHDSVADRGPLEGLRTGLSALGDRVEIAYATSCDAPFPVSAVIELVLATVGTALAMPRTAEREYPLTAAYHIATVLPVVEQLLNEGSRRLRAILNRLPVHFVDEPELRTVDPQLTSLRNLNTPQDYESALREFAGLS